MPSSSRAIPRGSLFTDWSRSSTIFGIEYRPRRDESIAPVGPHPQMITSVVSGNNEDDMVNTDRESDNRTSHLSDLKDRFFLIELVFMKPLLTLETIVVFE